MVFSKQGSTLGGALLIAGTSIGGGVLALPVLTSITGFFPSLLLFLLCWLFMTATGLLFGELCVWLKKDTNLLSMAETTLGKWGRRCTWLLYLFLFYCLTIAYLSGCSSLLVRWIGEGGDSVRVMFFFALVVALLVFAGVRVIGPINEGLVLVLGMCYLLFVVQGMGYIRWENLLHADWSYAPFTLPIIFVTFAYQGTVPTLARYLQYDSARIRKSLLWGTLLPLVAYVVWQTVVLGIVPLEGEVGLRATRDLGESAVYPLRFCIDRGWLCLIGEIFAFLAMLTSLLGVTIGMRDFFADGLQIRKGVGGRLALVGLIFVPATWIAGQRPHLFLQALDLAGGYGTSLLLGALPVLMVWAKRYGRESSQEEGKLLPGGKGVLLLLLLFVVIELICETVNLF